MPEPLALARVIIGAPADERSPRPPEPTEPCLTSSNELLGMPPPGDIAAICMFAMACKMYACCSADTACGAPPLPP